MKTSRRLGTVAVLATSALVLVPAAAASATSHRHHASALPDASAVVPVPAQKRVTTSGGPYTAGSTYPVAVATSLDWTIPACTGTVHADFALDQTGPQGATRYVQGRYVSDYPCTSAPQRVTVHYGPVSPASTTLHEGAVVVSTRTYGPAVSEGARATYGTLTRSTTVVEGGPRQPAGSTVLPTPVSGSHLAINADGSYGAVRWVIPACTGTVRAYFSVHQDGQAGAVALQQKAATDYRCSVAPQLVGVQYQPLDPGSRDLLHGGDAVLQVDTYAVTPGTTFGPLLQTGQTLVTVDDHR